MNQRDDNKPYSTPNHSTTFERRQSEANPIDGVFASSRGILQPYIEVWGCDSMRSEHFFY